MWALIMTMYVTGSSQQGLTISTLDNFQTEQACRYAVTPNHLDTLTDLESYCNLIRKMETESD